MEKIIIENRSDAGTYEVFKMVEHVMSMGRVSDNGKQYCYATRFNNGCVVSTFRNKASDRFVIYNDKLT